MNMTHHDDHNDPALTPIVNALEAESRAMRSEPDAGFESRLAQAALRAEPPAVVGRIGPLHRTPALRIAAGLLIAVTAGVGGFVLVGSPSGPQTQPSVVLDAETVAAEAEAAFAELFAGAQPDELTGLWAIGAESSTNTPNAEQTESIWDIGTSDPLSDLTLEDLL